MAQYHTDSVADVVGLLDDDRLEGLLATLEVRLPMGLYALADHPVGAVHLAPGELDN